MLELILGAIISILITIGIENLRKPKLSINLKQHDDNNYSNAPATNVRFLKVEVTNQPLHKYLRWILREPAMQVHANITFFHLDGQNVFGKDMLARWSGSPEPVLPRIILDNRDRGFIWDISKFSVSTNMDIYSGHSQDIDIAAKFDDDEECYGWNNEGYLSEPLWRNPNWKLSSERYLVKVIVSTAGEKITYVCRLINDVSRINFRLDNKLPQDDVISQ